MMRAQGGLEYLVILAAVIGIAAVVIYSISTVMSSQTPTAAISACKKAAVDCKASKMLSPTDPCILCNSSCKDQTTGNEIFPGATTCCTVGESSKIYLGSEECVPSPPINLAITAPSAGSWTAASTTLTATTAVSSTCYYGASASPATQMSTTGGLSHSQSLTGLTEPSATRYVRCTAGITSEEKSVTWNVDTTPPTVSITSPLDSATVSGTVSITVSASDSGSGVNRVRLYLNGFYSAMYQDDSSVPYSWSWVTITYPNQVTTLTASAYDNVGNQRSSSTISVTVSNVCATTPPGTSKCDNTCTFCSTSTQRCCLDESFRYFCYTNMDPCPA